MRRYTLILLDIQTLFCQFFLAPTKMINLEFFASYIYSTVCFKKSSPIKKNSSLYKMDQDFLDIQ